MATKREKKSDTPQVPSKPRAPRARKPPASKPLAAPRPARRPAAPKKPAAAPRAKAPARRVAPKAVTPPITLAGTALTDEERIEDAKYQPRTAPKRLFEEERFVFPESYGVTRIRLLVKDPEWIFVHWDVDSKTLAALRAELGERTMALTRLTLRIVDAEHGGGQTILLPPGARSWYVRADATGPRAYRAELGVTLPSGGFRALAESNTVVPPRVGPSPEVARLKRRFGRPPVGTSPAPSSEAIDAAPIASAEAASSPWQPSPSRTDGADPQPSVTGAQPGRRKRGGASELSGLPDRGGASDVHRR